MERFRSAQPPPPPPPPHESQKLNLKKRKGPVPLGVSGLLFTI